MAERSGSHIAEDAGMRDALAIDRTIMANERTLLAYVRTALALAALGATAVMFFENRWLLLLGWAAMALGLATAFIGVQRYRTMRKRLSGSITKSPASGGH